MNDDSVDEKRVKRLRIRWIVGVIAILAVVVGWWLTHSADSPMNNSAKTAKAEQQIADTVKSSMQEKFDSDTTFMPYHFQVVNVTVVHENGNKYNGIATLRTGKGTQHDVLVDVTGDPNGHMMWFIQPGQLLWALQDRDYSTGTSG